ncbi:uncharacterized protein (TIGR04255 family) [Novosphingobium fluoreni]|uniref:Uncharacterized protein (TIGR04255 family) n=1 Tax=Novosphingobium fluoreni TaxID=1391222 RepID=A0A7W6BZD5_9SPHN|nr:TIGR04255 family protein [Novosphingobium fluoreni]MBB3940671.1 uncharacterized protein (TIGR04255 family) [Novosphingobium fluoreni]
MQIPLRGSPPHQPILSPPLLLRALAGIRFSSVLKIGDETGAGIADFQDVVRSLYPFVQLEHEQALRFEVKQDGSIDSFPERHPAWRFQDKHKRWRMSLTPTSAYLDVGADGYDSWGEFSSRMAVIVDAVAEHFSPGLVLHSGVRYANLASVDDGKDPRATCARELVSITGNPDLVHADLQWRFAVDEGLLILRSGLLPPGTTYDPVVVEPRPDRNWYLDIDVVNADMRDFDASEIKQSVESQSARAHAIYCWAMSGPSSSKVS